ncbi:MAG: helix-turn-helix transcriptional regulator, partial [Acetobacter sp.]
MTGSRITDRLKALRERAGYTIRDFARAVGYGEKFSSYRTYETTYKKEVLPLGMVKAMVPVLSGRGTPPITANEVWNLAGVSAGESGLTATARRAHPPAGAPSGPATRSGMGTGYATGHDMGHTMGAGPGGGFGGGSRDESRPGSVEGYGEGYGGHLEGDSGRNSGAAPASGHGAGGEPPPATGANASSHPAQPRSRSLPQPLPSQV